MLNPGDLLDSRRRIITLASSVTSGAAVSSSRVLLPGSPRALIVTLDIASAERDSANETYDFYVVTGDGISEWDISHFPQVATTGAKRFTHRLIGTVRPENVSTAGPGVAANDTATLQTDTAGSNQGIKTLGAGLVRHGPFGLTIGYELVVAGTIVTGIVYGIRATAIY